MTLPDVLQWIGINRKTGLLELERGGNRRCVAFAEGKIVACALDDAMLLGHFLLSAGHIQPERLSEATERHRKSGQSLQRILVEEQWVLSSDLRSTLSTQTEEIVYGLFDWIDANFSFLDHAIPGPDWVQADLAVDEILLNGLQRVDETKMIRKVFHNSGIVLEKTGIAPPSQIANSGMARRILQSIDGKRTLAEILRYAQASEFLVLKFLYHLFHKEVLRISETRPVDPTVTTLVDELPRDDSPAAASEAGAAAIADVEVPAEDETPAAETAAAAESDDAPQAPEKRVESAESDDEQDAPPASVPGVSDEVVNSLADLARQLSGGLGLAKASKVTAAAQAAAATLPLTSEVGDTSEDAGPTPVDLGVETQIRMAEHLLAHDEGLTALQLLTAAQRLAPDHPDLTRLIEQAQATLMGPADDVAEGDEAGDDEPASDEPVEVTAEPSSEATASVDSNTDDATESAAVTASATAVATEPVEAEADAPAKNPTQELLPHRVPVLVATPGSDLPSEYHYLVALVDGRSTIQQILGVSPFSDKTVLQVLEGLVEKGIVALHDPES